MNEEQAVLDFFSRDENLPLGLAVAEQMNKLREQMNKRYRLELQQRLAASFTAHGLAWQVELTEGRNAPDNLVGLHCNVRPEQDIYLRPMVEQQHLEMTRIVVLSCITNSINMNFSGQKFLGAAIRTQGVLLQSTNGLMNYLV